MQRKGVQGYFVGVINNISCSPSRSFHRTPRGTLPQEWKNVFLSSSSINLNVSAPFVYPTTAFDESKKPSVRRGTNSDGGQHGEALLQVLLRCGCGCKRANRKYQLKVGNLLLVDSSSRYLAPSSSYTSLSVDVVYRVCFV